MAKYRCENESFNQLPPEEERALVKAMHQGDNKARERLWLSCQWVVKTRASKIARYYDKEVEEVEQDLQLIIAASLRSFDPDKGTRLATYIWRSINTTTRNYARRNKYKRSVELSPVKDGLWLEIMADRAAVAVGVVNTQDYDDDEERVFHKEVLRDAIKHLSPKRQRVIYRYFYNEETLQQIGTSMGVTREAVRQTREKAVKRLREIVDNKIASEVL